MKPIFKNPGRTGAPARPLLWIALGLAGCGGAGGRAVGEADAGEVDAAAPVDAAAVDAGPVAPVACGTALPGPPLPDGFVEAQGGYAEALAAVDLSLAPDPLVYAGESALQRATIDLMLGRAGGGSVSRADAIAAGDLGVAVVAAFAVDGTGELDFRFLRRGLHHFYPCSRPVPADLDELAARFGDYAAWPSETIACSRPKDGPRRLRADPGAGVYVAETLRDDGSVRETEVLFTGLRDDGQLDFAAYTADGELTDRSTFATASSETTAAAPYTCITCHIDRDSATISRLRPSGTGAGCD